MNGPEERLTNALKDVGETVHSADVPPPPFPDRSPSPGVLSRPLVVGALVTVFVLVIGGVFAGGYVALDRTFGDRSEKNAAAVAGERRVAVFLCIPTTSNSACGMQAASELQKQDVQRRLEAMPQVRRLTYESQEQAYARFKERFAGNDDFVAKTRKGDLADSFRVEVADDGAARAVKAAIDGLPGVDKVVIEPLAPRA
ncbi:permease-like cell division protein FtsX [Actinomadura sp. 3N508]|uniref:permease-like cell division protein FtsX n=1 Tax=Actinomadura sp. 3N508 TaxID=3375153 RepID=UPI0037B97527